MVERSTQVSPRALSPIGIDRAHREHTALVYRTAEELRSAVAAYFRAGIAAGERCVYILSDSTLIEILDALDEEGVDVPGEASRGSFRIMRAEQIYLRSGSFDADRTIDLVRAALNDALADGHSGLRAAGEMAWALESGTSLAALVDYEKRLNTTVFPGGRLTGLCLYDARRFDAASIRAIELAHPLCLRDSGDASATLRGPGHRPMVSAVPETAQDNSFTQVR